MRWWVWQLCEYELVNYIQVQNLPAKRFLDRASLLRK